ncbi:hypothetical protein EDD18DRAFT_79419 [Armillaria luteobubalina]|uniref:Uncharacterized protein n=1 Tax=Armillaria luteobubalina TaxID=153913 RepID=A0AA39UYD8_9AGAR|nr:hypothetical protein EDD18DRAFT_79419 [Armillaria luteobubalina]
MPYYSQHRWSNSESRYQRHAGPSTASRKPKSLSGEYALGFFFRYCPKFPKPAGFEGEVDIRDPAQYDMHLHPGLILKDIIHFPDMLDQLAGVVDSRLRDFSGYLPRVSRYGLLHPTRVSTYMLPRCSGPSAESDSETDILNSILDRYIPLQLRSSLVASVLFAGLDRWSNIFRYSMIPHSMRPYALAGRYTSLDTNVIAGTGLPDDLNRDIQLVIETGLSESLIIWDFQCINAGSEGVMRAISYLTGSTFPWACCPTSRSCGGRSCRKTDGMSDFQFAVTGYKTGEDGGIFEDSSDIEFGVSSSGAFRFDKSNINSSVDSVLSTSGQKFNIERGNVRFEGDSGINNGAVSFNEDDFTNALKIIQQIWAEAVNVDATFIVLNAGNREFIGIRDRKLQRLYLSPLIDLDNPSSFPAGYFEIHTGLKIAAVLDAIQHAKRLNALSHLPALYTFEYDRGD